MCQRKTEKNVKSGGQRKRKRHKVFFFLAQQLRGTLQPSELPLHLSDQQLVVLTTTLPPRAAVCNPPPEHRCHSSSPCSSRNLCAAPPSPLAAPPSTAPAYLFWQICLSAGPASARAATRNRRPSSVQICSALQLELEAGRCTPLIERPTEPLPPRQIRTPTPSSTTRSRRRQI